MTPCLASEQQKAFFREIETLPGLVLGLKNAEYCSVNFHGRYRLWDKKWSESESETLLAFMRHDEGEPSLTRPDGEPLVHLHVDWKLVKYCVIGDRDLSKIGTTKELVFALDSSAAQRVFAFYSNDTPELQALLVGKSSKCIPLFTPKP